MIDDSAPSMIDDPTKFKFVFYFRLRCNIRKIFVCYNIRNSFHVEVHVLLYFFVTGTSRRKNDNVNCDISKIFYSAARLHKDYKYQSKYMFEILRVKYTSCSFLICLLSIVSNF